MPPFIAVYYTTLNIANQYNSVNWQAFVRWIDGFMFGELAKETLPCLTFGVVFGCLSWSGELELESGVGDLRILCGTLLFVSRFITLSSQSNPKTQPRELGVRYIREFCRLGQRPKIWLEIYSWWPHGRFQLGADALFCFRHSIYRIDRIKEIGIGMANFGDKKHLIYYPKEEYNMHTFDK